MTSAAPRALFAGLVDDAALFPPRSAPMTVALREHVQHRQAPFRDLIGPFVCPVSRVGELLAALPDDQSLDLSLVVDDPGDATHQALRAVGGDARLTLTAVEAPLRLLGEDAKTIGANLRRLPGVTGYLEVARTGFDAGLDLVAQSGWHAPKYRTGSARPDEVPDALQLSGFVVECVRRGLPFKLTAGLHHAVATGPDGHAPAQHGIVNVLAAVAAAQAGAAHDRVAGIVATSAADALAAEVARWSADTCAAVRSSFRSFGCCAVTEPIDDLLALGLLDGTIG